MKIYKITGVQNETFLMDTSMDPHRTQRILPNTNYLPMSHMINFNLLQNATNNFHFVIV